MHHMSTVSVHRPEFRSFFPNGRPSSHKCLRTTSSRTMAMGSKFHAMMENKKEEVSVQLSTPSLPVVEVLRSDHLHFDQLQHSDQELAPENSFEFGKFVAREAMLDEEFWTAAWLRAESHWEDRTHERYIDNYKRKFAEQESVKAPPLVFCRIDRTPPSRYGYIANLCVAKSARRLGIASNMLYLATDYAKSHGVEQVYVHVDPNNRPAQILYQKMGFEMVGTHLSPEQPYLLRLHI